MAAFRPQIGAALFPAPYYDDLPLNAQITATGGMTFGGSVGSGGQAFTSVYQIGAEFFPVLSSDTEFSNVYVYAGTGDLVTGGAATTRVQIIKVYAASGGLTSGGVGVIEHNNEYPAGGGLISGGAATTSTQGAALNIVGDYVASGGALFGGAAATAFPHTQIYLPSGGAIFGGAATTSYTIPIISTVEQLGAHLLPIAAEADFSTGVVNTYGYIASGGMETRQLVYLVDENGNYIVDEFGNRIVIDVIPYTGVFAKEKGWSAGGGLTSGGFASTVLVSTSPNQNTFIYIAHGGGTFGGDATTIITNRVYTYVPTGGLIAGGAVTTGIEKSAPVSGGAVTGGTAAKAHTKTMLASGGMTAGGDATTEAPPVRTIDYIASGGMVFGGSGSQIQSGDEVEVVLAGEGAEGVECFVVPDAPFELKVIVGGLSGSGTTSKKVHITENPSALNVKIVVNG